MIPFVKLIDASTGNLICINANYIVSMTPINTPGVAPFTTLFLQAAGPVSVNLTIEQIDQLIHHAQQQQGC